MPRLATLQRRGDTELAGNLCRRGRIAFDTASAADLRSLRAAVEPVYRDLERDPATRAAIDAIAALKREVAAAAGQRSRRASARRRPRRRPARRSTGPGRWTPAAAPPRRSTSTRTGGTGSSCSTAGASPITQQNRTSCTWGYGTYTVDGDRTTWRFTDGGGEAPNGAMNQPGEEFSFRLSVYRDTVTLGPVKGAISPLNFDAEPWRRTRPSVAREAEPALPAAGRGAGPVDLAGRPC